ncbi:MAG: M1 family aminopeptidase [Myxococcota bacterium]
MSGLALAWAASGDGGWVDALTLVDRLAWAASDREVAAYLRGLRSGPVAESVDPGAPLGTALYAAEVDLIEASSPAGEREFGLSVREAVVWRNPAEVAVRTVALRVFGAGQDLHPNGALVRGVWVDNRPARWSLDATVLSVELPRPVGPGELARLLVHVDERVPGFSPGEPVHEGSLPLEGLGAYGHADGSVNLGWFLPVVTAVDRRGGFDVRPLYPNTEHVMSEPATFHVVFDVPSRFVVASTGIDRVTRTDGGQSTVVAVAGGARDFAAMLVPNAAVTEAEVEGVRLRVVHPASDPRAGADLLARATGALGSYVRWFGPPAAREIDVVEAPLRGLMAVDFPGMVAIDLRHQGAPYHPTAAQEWNLAHELAHQWWGVDVGSDPVASPWLDEALASYCAALYWSEKYGEDAVQARYELEVRDRLATLSRHGVEDLPADRPGYTYDLDQLAAIVQGRGSLFFDQVRGAVGDEPFFAALRGYHATYRGRFAVASDLVRALAEASDDPAVQEQVRAQYERWIREAHSYEDLL